MDPLLLRPRSEWGFTRGRLWRKPRQACTFRHLQDVEKLPKLFELDPFGSFWIIQVFLFCNEHQQNRGASCYPASPRTCFSKSPFHRLSCRRIFQYEAPLYCRSYRYGFTSCVHDAYHLQHSKIWKVFGGSCRAAPLQDPPSATWRDRLDSHEGMLKGDTAAAACRFDGPSQGHGKIGEMLAWTCAIEPIDAHGTSYPKKRRLKMGRRLGLGADFASQLESDYWGDYCRYCEILWIWRTESCSIFLMISALGPPHVEANGMLWILGSSGV